MIPRPTAENCPNRLRMLRQHQDLTLDRACSPIGITRAHLQRLETGTRELTMPVMLRAADCYGIYAADLFNSEHGGLSSQEREIIEIFRAASGSGKAAIRAVTVSQREWNEAQDP